MLAARDDVELAQAKDHFGFSYATEDYRDLLSGVEVDVSEISGQDSTALLGPTPATWADPEIAGGGYAHAQISHSSGLLFWLSELRAKRVFAAMSAHSERARMHLRRHDGQHVVEDVDENAGGYECDGPPNNFADLILGKTEINWPPGEAAMRGVEMLDAAYRSAVSGQEEQV